MREKEKEKYIEMKIDRETTKKKDWHWHRRHRNYFWMLLTVWKMTWDRMWFWKFETAHFGSWVMVMHEWNPLFLLSETDDFQVLHDDEVSLSLEYEERKSIPRHIETHDERGWFKWHWW